MCARYQLNANAIAAKSNGGSSLFRPHAMFVTAFCTHYILSRASSCVYPLCRHVSAKLAAGCGKNVDRYGVLLQEARVPRAHQHVPRHFEAEPATRHAWCDFEQIRHNALVQALDALCHDDLLYCIANTCIFIAHAAHRVDLKSSS